MTTPHPDLFREPIAHRGLHDQRNGIIENSSSAFDAAIARDFSIECDVLLSKDHHPVVFHDLTLDRLTDETGPVVERTLKELQQISLTGSADKIQSLQELLDQVAGQVPIFVELKSHWDGATFLAQRVSEVLAGYTGLAATMSFDPRLVSASKHWLPHLPHGIVSEAFRDTDEWSPMTDWQRMSLRNMVHWPTTRPDFISYDIADLPSGAVSFFRKVRKVPVICWTVRNAQQQLKAKKYCDQITFEGFDPRLSP